MTSNYRENRPTAEILMTSMRSIGYSFEAAVADVIDNSISAYADKVELYFPIDPTKLYVSICDNGYGMTADELYDAKGTSLTTKKSLHCKAIIQKHSKDFSGTLDDPDVIKICGCSRNSYYNIKER